MILAPDEKADLTRLSLFENLIAVKKSEVITKFGTFTGSAKLISFKFFSDSLDNQTIRRSIPI